METLLEIEELACGYGAEPVVDGLNLHLHEGGIGCLLGPSGCGKTTVLRAIAGLEPLRGGRIALEGRTLASAADGLPPDRRRVGLVFQDYALFPHLTAAENVAFGLKGLPRRARRDNAAGLLDLVGLAGLGERYPHELSGGQQQRVAVARALAPAPRLLLLDEPFSNLDVELRERLGQDIRTALKSRGIAALFVTHDQQEAFLLGERVGVMHRGRLLQWDTPYQLYHEPADRFVADFIGEGRFLAGRLRAPDVVETELGAIRGNVAYAWPRGARVELLLRPDDLVPDPESPVRGMVTARAFRGAETLYSLRLPSGTELLMLAPSRQDFAVGATVGLRAVVDHFIAFRDAG
ncbi:MAG: ABC transporter ATP-binding protein [Gammaproteobacteria bacterium]|nr:ABC transporter ATP-binding protein [Gammaproteobacteria bacterium]